MNAWIFDIDGVITDPQEKKIVEPKILHLLNEVLKNEDVIAFNTGRSFSWTLERVLTPLTEVVTDKEHLKNLFVSCEKGNVLATYEKDEWQKKLLDDSFPEELIKTVKDMTETEFSDCMFFDNSKETMISVEMKDGFDIAIYTQRQEALQKKLTEIVMNDEYRDLNFRLDASHISIDLQYEDAGKKLGAERIEDWMTKNRFSAHKFYLFGDSSSDSEMAEEIQTNHPTTFIYVNNKETLNSEKLLCEVVYTKEKYTRGTLEFLSSKIS